MAEQQQEEKPKRTLQDYLDEIRPMVADCLPKHIPLARYMRQLVMPFRRCPKLQGCDPKSITDALMVCASMGLTPCLNDECWVRDGKDNMAEWEVGSVGLQILVWRTGIVDSLECHLVYGNDDFQIQLGSAPSIQHLVHAAEHGPVVGAYVVMHRIGGRYPMIEWMNDADVKVVEENRRNKGGQSPWKGPHRLEMYKKTVMKRFCKRLPKSADAHQAAVLDDRRGPPPVPYAPDADTEPPVLISSGDVTVMEECDPWVRESMDKYPDEFVQALKKCRVHEIPLQTLSASVIEVLKEKMREIMDGQ